ncbi:MAG: hypothetical protein ACI9S9_003539 [Planctomycetota bacterium]|jgi:hypothetical protein
MRALLVIVLLLAVGTVVTLSLGAGGDVPMPPGGTAVPDEFAGIGDLGPVIKVPRITKLPEGVVATRTEQETIDPEGLADQATACLRVIDHITEKAISGAFIRSMHNGADIAFTDEHGLAGLPLASPAQMAVVFDGYLLRLAPVQLGSTEAEPQIVRLVPDRWSLRRRFAFVDPDGKAVNEVFVRLKPAGQLSSARIPVPAGDAVLQRAWSEHSMLSTREVSRDVAVQLGRYSADRVHQLTGRTPMIRFAVPGDFVLEASTTNGLVARVEVAVIPGSEPSAQVVNMTAGASIRGRVTNLASSALAGVEITIQGGDPLGLRATTAANGTFMIGPLPIARTTLLVRHGTHAPVAHGPVAAPSKDVRIKLTPLTRTPLRGRVRTRPGLASVANATIIWQVAGGAAISAKTAADGTFELQAAGDIASKLIVQAPGHVRYSELVDPNAAFADYDLWPGDWATRVANGTTASLEGVVIGANGWPLANASVRWRSDHPTGVSGMPGRRVLEGAVLQLPGVATTDSSGAFVIETNQFGRGVVSLVSAPNNNIEATAIAGKSKKGLKLNQ